MGYPRWADFLAVITRAMDSARNLGLTSQFRDVPDLVTRPQGGSATRLDYHLTRQAAYLVAMNGDPRKPQVAAAQAYFAQSALIREGHMEDPDPQHSAAQPTGVPVETLPGRLKLPLTCHFVGADNTATPCDLQFCAPPQNCRSTRFPAPDTWLTSLFTDVSESLPRSGEVFGGTDNNPRDLQFY
jgi:hypothetical protein